MKKVWEILKKVGGLLVAALAVIGGIFLFGKKRTHPNIKPPGEPPKKVEAGKHEDDYKGKKEASDAQADKQSRDALVADVNSRDESRKG